EACRLAGVTPRFKKVSLVNGKFYTDSGHAFTPTEYVVSRNLHRRHLTPEQKREVIAALLKADPRQSNRRIAEQARADHKAVGAVREQMEGRGDIPHVETRADTKGRLQPANKRNDKATASDSRTYQEFRSAQRRMFQESQASQRQAARAAFEADKDKVAEEQ